MRAEDNVGLIPVAHALRGEGFDASEDGTGRGTPLVPMAFPAEMSGTQAASTEQVSPSLSVKHTTAVAFDMRGRDGGAMPEGPHDTASVRAASGGSSRSYIAQPMAFPINTQLGLRGAETSNSKREGIGLGEDGDPSFTLQAHHSHAVATAMAVRRLTPVECERLMGFQDSWTQISWRGKPADQCPDGPRYKACGNSWAVNCGEFIFDRIKAVEEMAEDFLPVERAACRASAN